MAMPIFGCDFSSFQGNPDWAAVDRETAFGWEKATQGTWYVNPYWNGPKGHNKSAMAARESASGFIPGAYHFLEAGNAAAQADHFASHAGNLAGWAIMVDVEPTAASRPTLADARAFVSRCRKHYPHHRITGYIPKWYWGNRDTTFVDVLFASRYVSGTGTPAQLYKKVTSSMWDGYGGRKPALLQFTDQAEVSGVGGLVDCSAFRGTPAELRKAILPAHPAAKEEEEDRMMLENGAGAETIICFVKGSRSFIAFGSDNSRTNSPRPVLRVAMHDADRGWSQVAKVTLPNSSKAAIQFERKQVNMVGVVRIGDNEGDNVPVGYNLG
jgi:GH25 family lysozyme M1 (1,4-beta-N-acetylmuramidase)